MANDTEKRMIRVLDYIHDHPAGDLSLDALADVAAMSRFHWHRVFRGITGETAAQAVRRMRSHAGMVFAENVPLDPPLEVVTLPAGRHAVLQFKGPYAGLAAAYDHLFGVWLPTSGMEPRNSPVFEIYLNTPMDTAPEDLLTELCLPLA